MLRSRIHPPARPATLSACPSWSKKVTHKRSLSLCARSLPISSLNNRTVDSLNHTRTFPKLRTLSARRKGSKVQMFQSLKKKRKDREFQDLSGVEDPQIRKELRQSMRNSAKREKKENRLRIEAVNQAAVNLIEQESEGSSSSKRRSHKPSKSKGKNETSSNKEQKKEQHQSNHNNNNQKNQSSDIRNRIELNGEGVSVHLQSPMEATVKDDSEKFLKILQRIREGINNPQSRPVLMYLRNHNIDENEVQRISEMLDHTMQTWMELRSNNKDESTAAMKKINITLNDCLCYVLASTADRSLYHLSILQPLMVGFVRSGRVSFGLHLYYWMKHHNLPPDNDHLAELVRALADQEWHSIVVDIWLEYLADFRKGKIAQKPDTHLMSVFSQCFTECTHPANFDDVRQQEPRFVHDVFRMINRDFANVKDCNVDENILLYVFDACQRSNPPSYQSALRYLDTIKKFQNLNKDGTPKKNMINVNVSANSAQSATSNDSKSNNSLNDDKEPQTCSSSKPRIADILGLPKTEESLHSSTNPTTIDEPCSVSALLTGKKGMPGRFPMTRSTEALTEIRLSDAHWASVLRLFGRQWANWNEHFKTVERFDDQLWNDLCVHDGVHYGWVLHLLIRAKQDLFPDDVMDENEQQWLKQPIGNRDARQALLDYDLSWASGDILSALIDACASKRDADLAESMLSRVIRKAVEKKDDEQREDQDAALNIEQVRSMVLNSRVLGSLIGLYNRKSDWKRIEQVWKKFKQMSDLNNGSSDSVFNSESFCMVCSSLMTGQSVHSTGQSDVEDILMKRYQWIREQMEELGVQDRTVLWNQLFMSIRSVKAKRLTQQIWRDFEKQMEERHIEMDTNKMQLIISALYHCGENDRALQLYTRFYESGGADNAVALKDSVDELEVSDLRAKEQAVSTMDESDWGFRLFDHYQLQEGGQTELDFHGFRLGFACVSLQYLLEHEYPPLCLTDSILSQNPNPNLSLVVGRGKHSFRGKSMLRTAIEDLCSNRMQPPIETTDHPHNPGSMVLSAESIVAWRKARKLPPAVSRRVQDIPKLSICQSIINSSPRIPFSDSESS